MVRPPHRRKDQALASAVDDGVINVVGLPSGQTNELRGHKRKVLALAFSPNGQWLASGGEDNELILWAPSTAREAYRLERSSRRAVRFLAFNDSGTALVAVDESGGIPG